MLRPELRQIIELSSDDFVRHPVWVGVHTVDTDETWYGETDEDTYRPWAGKLPVPDDVEFLLVRASFRLHDGGEFSGFVRPATKCWDRPPRPGIPSLSARFGGSPLAILGDQQPRMFVEVHNSGGKFPKWFGFWGGIAGIPSEMRKSFYQAVDRTPTAVFPIEFEAIPGLALGSASGRLDGFYKAVKRAGVAVEL